MKSQPFSPLTPERRAQLQNAADFDPNAIEYTLVVEGASWGAPVCYRASNRAALDRRASSMVLASGAQVRVTIENGSTIRPFAVYSLRPGRHGHKGRNHLPSCPVIVALASEFRS